MCLGAIVPLPPKARCPAAQHAGTDDEEVLCRVPFGVTLQGLGLRVPFGVTLQGSCKGLLEGCEDRRV